MELVARTVRLNKHNLLRVSGDPSTLNKGGDMKMIQKMLTIACVAFIVASVGMAGFTHSNGKTSYMDSATSVSLWRRNNSTQEVYPATVQEVMAFDNSVKILQATNTTKYCCGFWEIDANSDYQPLATDSAMYANRKDFGAITDVEWELDSNGDICPKD